MTHRIAYLVICTLFVIPLPGIFAQDGYPLPDVLPAITAENAVQLTQLATIGGVLPGQLAWSPDGQTLAVGTTDGAKLYDINNPEQPPITVDGGTDVGFSEDGSTLISGGQEWAVETGNLLGAFEPSLPRSPSGRLEIEVENATEEVVVHLRDVNTDETISLHTEIPSGLEEIVFSPDEDYAALAFETGHMYAWVQLWNLEEERLIKTLEQLLEYVGTLAFFANGSRLAVSSYTDAMYAGLFSDVKIYDGRTGEVREPVTYITSGPVEISGDTQYAAYQSVIDMLLWSDHLLGTPPIERGVWADWEFSPDSQFLATSAASEGLTQIWQLGPNSMPSDPILTIETDAAISHLNYSHDGKLLAGKTNDGIVVIWDTSTGEELTTIETNTDLAQIEFSPSDALLLAVVFDGEKLIWEVEAGNLVSRLPRTSLLNSDWSQAAYWQYGTVQVVNILGGGQLELDPIENYFGPMVAFHAMTEQAVFEGDKFYDYNLRTGEIAFDLPTTDRQSNLWFNETGTHLFRRISPIVYPEETELLEIWDISETQQPLFTVSDVNKYVLLSPDERYVAELWQCVGECSFGRETLWDAQTGEVLAIWELGVYFNNHAFSPDSRLLATGEMGRGIALWDVEATIEQPALREDVGRYVDGVANALLPFQAAFDVQAIRFSSNGEWLVAMGPSNAYLWYLPYAIEQGEDEATYHLIENVEVAEFSPDNQFLLTQGAGNTTLQLWELDTDSPPISRATIEGAHPEFSADGSMLITHGENGISVWNVEALLDGDVAPILVVELESDPILEMGWSANGDLIFVRRLDAVQVYGIGG